MSYLVRSLCSLVLILLLFQGMVAAFHLLNLPSDRAVAEGVGLLLGIVLAGFVGMRMGDWAGFGTGWWI